MGATTMKAVPCPMGEWTLVADGASVASTGVQSALIYPVAITIAASLPAVDTDDWVYLPESGFNADLEAADKLYARPIDKASKVRCYRVAR